MTVLPFVSNSTRSSTSSASTSTSAVTSPLGPQLCGVENSSQRLRHAAAVDPPGSARAVKGGQTVEIPLYCARAKLEGDRIDDLKSFSEAWGALYEHLTQPTLTESDVLDVLKSGILQRRMGRNLEHLFVAAVMRSIQPRGDQSAQRLREIVEVVCHLPQNTWADALGEHLNFAQGMDNRSVAGFIQAQLTSARQRRDEKIANGALLTNAQWQGLCEILYDSPVWLSDRVEQALDEETANRPLVDIDDIAHIRPSPADAQTLMKKCLQALSENPAKKALPSQYKNRIDQLVRCITDKSDPPLLTPRNAEEITSFDFPKPPESQTGRVTPPVPNKGSEGLLALLEEIERKSDFYDEVDAGGPQLPSGLVARAVYGINALNVLNVHNLDAYPEKPNPKPHLLLASKATPPVVASDFMINPPSSFENSPRPTLGHKPVLTSGGAEHVLEMARQADALLTDITHTFTGWKPVEAAMDLTKPRLLLSQIIEYTNRLNIRTPLRVASSSSHGAEGNLYAATTQASEAEAVGNLEFVGASLATWLHSAAGYLGTAGGTVVAHSLGAAQQHPRATATVALAAVHAAVNAFYVRWFTDSAEHKLSHVAPDTDPELRKHIVDNVGSTLNAMPEVVQSVRARMATSTYADPYQDPALVPAVKSLLQRPLAWSPDMTAAELVDESVFNARHQYAHLRVSRLDVDVDGNGHIEVQDIPATSYHPESSASADEIAQWVIDSLSEADMTLRADQKLQAEVVGQLTARQNTPLPVSTDSWIHKPLSLYQEALNAPTVIAWFESKALALDTLEIHADSISANVTRNGVTAIEEFSIWDTSGWWQVSAQVLIARQVLDPGDHGLPYVNEDPKLIPRNVILEFYGQNPPSTAEEATGLGGRLKSDGWPTFDNIKKSAALDLAKETIKEEKARAQLSYELEQCVRDKEDDEQVLLSSRFSRVANGSPLDQKSSAIVHHLNDFLQLPEMIEICKSRDFDCADSPVRISEDRIQVLNPDTQWHDITNLLGPTLKAPFDELLRRVKETGNALYSTLSFDLLQTLNFRGFGSPKTAGEIRNVIRWLQTSLPQAMSLGDCGARLLAPSESPATLMPADRAKIIGVSSTLLKGASSIIEALGCDLPFDSTVEQRRVNAEVMLEQMLTTAQSDSWGQQLIKALGWYGASEGQSASIEQQQHLLLAAIKLAIDPDTAGNPGIVAGYDIYQPKNLGRDLKAVRAEIEQHLVEHKGVSLRTAPLVAHLFLADAAPEFLAQDIGEEIKVGTAGWMTLRLGVAIAETQKPGCSRAMTAEQLMALALLTPTEPEQQSLFKGLAIDILVVWGIMNGVVAQRRNASYSANDYSVAARKFATQRSELSQAFEGFKRDVPTREDIGLRELRKLYDLPAETPIETIKVEHNGIEKSFVEAYIDGDLSEAGWYMSNFSMSRHDFDWRRRKLPDLNAIVTAAVDNYYRDYQNSYIVAVKSLIASLSLEDRQRIELGAVTILTLRGETGKLLEDEDAKSKAAFRGQQGVILRSEHKKPYVYFEIFPGRMSIIKRTDVPDDLLLNGVIKKITTKISKGPAFSMPIRRGTEVPFDFSAYFEGSAPREGARSQNIIIEKLGSTLNGRTVSGNQEQYVPGSYFSNKTADIANRIVNDNLLLGQREFIFKQANGLTTAEENRLFWGKVKDFLLQLIPFVGCVDDLKSGERIRFINGAFGCFTDLISGLNALAGGAVRISNVLKSVSSITVKAFETLKITGGTLLSAVNPLDGIPDLIAGGGRALGAFGKLLMNGSFALTEAGISRLSTCVDRLRAYFGGFASAAAGRVPRRANLASVIGRINNTNVAAILESGKWYALDQRGNPIGRPLNNFVATPTARE